MTMYDAIIVGGGPAGLSAALVLGRCRRRVLVCDAGRPRNAASREMHGYLTRDGIRPDELLRLGREELEGYGVEFRKVEVVEAACLGKDGFRVVLHDGTRLDARKLLLATGVRDILPAIEGIEEFYGLGVHHCPYCDGWEHRDTVLVAYGRGRAGLGLAMSLRTWSERVVVCTDGRAYLGRRDLNRLGRNGVGLRQERVVRLEGEGGRLARLVFASGPPLDCGAMFFNTGQYQRSSLPTTLGCVFKKDGGVKHDHRQRTGVPGLYLAGDASRDVQFVIVAAAEGAKAATAINRELQDEDRGEPAEPPSPSRAELAEEAHQPGVRAPAVAPS